MSGDQVRCPMCDRDIPLRSDGRLRAHLAEHGRRGQCDGSGMRAEHVNDIDRDEWHGMSTAAQFNARDEWAKVDALYWEYETMRDAGGASYAALRSAYEAVRRAVEDAGALAPWWLVEPPEDANGAA